MINYEVLVCDILLFRNESDSMRLPLGWGIMFMCNLFPYLFLLGHLTAMLRDLVLTKMGRNGDEATVAEAQRRFEEHVSGTKPLPADLRTPVRSYKEKKL